MQLTFATRSSGLARWQTARVVQLLQAAHPGLVCREHPISTSGDRELEEPLLARQADVSVHSLEDLPVEDRPGLVIAAIPEREEAYEALIASDGWTFSSLPAGARVGTSGARRVAQLLARRPDLNILPLNGDVDTPLTTVLHGEFDAIVLAQAALTWLGLQSHITEVLTLESMLPAPGQGAIAVQCRADDEETRALLASIHAPQIEIAVRAERAFLAGMDAECSLPIAAYAEHSNGVIILTGEVLSVDGAQSIRLSAADTEPEELGARLAALVLERGAAELLKARA